MVVADRIELPLNAYQTLFLPLKDATILGGGPLTARALIYATITKSLAEPF